MEEYEELAGESTVWSEYLLCSFTSEAFMIAFHNAHFGDLDTAGIAKDRQQLEDFFNRAGRARRKRVLRSNRSFTFTGLIYQSELERVARGTGVYGSIPALVRKRTFEHITRVLQDSELKMRLVVVNGEKVGKAKLAWRDYETVGVMGGIFSLWNYHSGSIGWSENHRYVRHHLDLIMEMQTHAAYKTAEETLHYLKHLTARL